MAAQDSFSGRFRDVVALITGRDVQICLGRRGLSACATGYGWVITIDLLNDPPEFWAMATHTRTPHTEPVAMA